MGRSFAALRMTGPVLMVNNHNVAATPIRMRGKADLYCDFIHTFYVTGSIASDQI